VRVQLASTTDPLNLAEVKVNGIAATNLPAELAAGRPATQSSIEAGALPGRAVDGNLDGALANGSVAATSEADEPNPWWQVDLGSVLSVHDVVLHNRTDACCSGRLANLTVFVSSTDMTGRTYADLLADASIAKVNVAGAAGAVRTVPFTTSTATPSPIIDIDLTTAVPVTIDIPGYISVPQGRVRISTTAGMEAGKTLSLGGGVLAATVELSAARPATFAFGLVNPIVMHTLKIVSVTTTGTPVVSSTAIVQVKENGAYAVNGWSTQ
jgi:hypothetical protein